MCRVGAQRYAPYTGLFAGSGVNQLGQAVNILDHQSAAWPFEQAHPRETIKFAGDRLAMGCDAACDLDVGGGGLMRAPFPSRCPSVANLKSSAWIRFLTARVLNSYTRVVRARIFFTNCGNSASATRGSVRRSSLNASADKDATRQSVRASTLADRGPRSIAGYSPKASPGPITLKLTALPVCA